MPRRKPSPPLLSDMAPCLAQHGVAPGASIYVAEALVQQGYLLAEDLPTVAEQAAQRYDMFRGR
jgi:hypothetical protein